MTHEQTILSRLMDILIYLLLGLVSALAILPFIYVLINSFSATEAVIPTKWTLDAYRYILSTDKFIRSMGVSIYITLLGSILSLIVTSLMAYALSKRTVPGRK